MTDDVRWNFIEWMEKWFGIKVKPDPWQVTILRRVEAEGELRRFDPIEVPYDPSFWWGYWDMSAGRPGFPVIENPGAIIGIKTTVEAFNPHRRPRRKRRTLRKRRAICTFGKILAFQGWKVENGGLVRENGLANV